MKKYSRVVPILIAVLALGLFSTAFTFTGTTSAIQPNQNFEPVSDQVWAVSVSADPGHEGALNQSFEAAYKLDQETGEMINYFNIEQRAYTSSGETRRYISISSPESHGYVMEDMTVTGMADIRESFLMDNMLNDVTVELDWFDLF